VQVKTKEGDHDHGKRRQLGTQEDDHDHGQEEAIGNKIR